MFLAIPGKFHYCPPLWKKIFRRPWSRSVQLAWGQCSVPAADWQRKKKARKAFADVTYDTIDCDRHRVLLRWPHCFHLINHTRCRQRVKGERPDRENIIHLCVSFRVERGACEIERARNCHFAADIECILRFSIRNS